MQDLKLLEAGIVVNYPVERVVRCGVLIHPADNLEAHGVGGFSQCFSSKDICRTDLLLKYYKLILTLSPNSFKAIKYQY